MVGPVTEPSGSCIVERARQDAGGGGLADAAHAGEHPGLRDAPGLERVRDRAHHGLLADQVVEGRRPVLARQHPIMRRALRRRPSRGRARSDRRGWWRRSSCLQPRDARPRRVRETGGRLTSDPNRSSLGLLPSGPDPVGEWLVHRQPPAPYIGGTERECKPRWGFPC